MNLMELFNMATPLIAVVSVIGFILIRSYEFLGDYRRHRLRRSRRKRNQQRLEDDRKRLGERAIEGGRSRSRNRKQLPSLSRGLVGLAIRRLPKGIAPAEKRRWADEMLADIGSVEGRFRRLRVAFNIWRKGAPAIPAGKSEAPRRASE